jgi:hypothetical protein
MRKVDEKRAFRCELTGLYLPRRSAYTILLSTDFL